MNIPFAQSSVARIAGQVVLLTALSFVSSATPTGSGIATEARAGTVAARMALGDADRVTIVRDVIDLRGDAEVRKTFR